VQGRYFDNGARRLQGYRLSRYTRMEEAQMKGVNEHWRLENPLSSMYNKDKTDGGLWYVCDVTLELSHSPF